MKKLIALLALVASTAFGTTLAPVQLLNPSGSTAGQAILSTGPSSAPAWGTVTLGGVSGTLAIANGGTGSTTQSGALSAILGSSAIPIANGGTGATSSAGAITNLGLGTAATQATGTSGATLPFLNGTNTWSAAQTFSVRPTFNGATPWDSSNLPSPAQTTGATFTGAITPSTTAGIKGTTLADNATAGGVGEFVSGTASAVSVTSGVPLNVTSISLTAGDWDVCGNVYYSPAGTTVIQAGFAAVSSTSATLPGAATGTLTQFNVTLTAGSPMSLPALCLRFNVSTTTTIYLVGESIFTTSTLTANGYMRARRIR